MHTTQFVFEAKKDISSKLKNFLKNAVKGKVLVKKDLIINSFDRLTSQKKKPRSKVESDAQSIIEEPNNVASQKKGTILSSTMKIPLGVLGLKQREPQIEHKIQSNASNTPNAQDGKAQVSKRPKSSVINVAKQKQMRSVSKERTKNKVLVALF